MKLYRATSLDDIAKQFRNMANEAENRMNRSTTKDARNHEAGKTIAYRAAATMLENMELVELNNPADNVQIKING